MADIVIKIEATALESLLRKAVSDEVTRIISSGQFPTPYNTHEEDSLIGSAEACEILGCSSRTLQRYRDRKCFTVIMRGPHKALYHRSEILAFRDANARSNRNNLI